MGTTVLFQANTNGYVSYRIPALLNLPGGRLLAFCEGRVHSLEDYGAIKVLLRISADNGRTFSPQLVVAEHGADTVGNPVPVYDRDTGRIFLFLNMNKGEEDQELVNRNLASRFVWVVTSDDLGETWSKPVDLTETLKPKGWTWLACGPCHGLQTCSGRLIIPCCHGVYDEQTGMSPAYRAHVYVSDDHGGTWRVGGEVDADTDEAAIAELPDGRLYFNLRANHIENCRFTAYSDDGGEHFSHALADHALPDPCCQASVLYDSARKRLLLCNNPFPYSKGGAGRRDLTLKGSADGGATWEKLLCLHKGPSAYSDLAIMEDGRIACLYECGESFRYERIELQLLSCP